MVRRCGTALAGMALVLAVLGVGGCSSGGSGSVDNAGGRDVQAPAKSLVDAKCSMCHSLDRVYSASKTKAQWDVTMTRMKSNGLVITDADYAAILDYLSK